MTRYSKSKCFQMALLGYGGGASPQERYRSLVYENESKYEEINQFFKNFTFFTFHNSLFSKNFENGTIVSISIFMKSG